ncbi:MAG: hypothetical protein JRJ56_06955 [Deltaproteobacteria bacterium]|nr:hypothetical protein [Deltaproteobacteria bacterium]
MRRKTLIIAAAVLAVLVLLLAVVPPLLPLTAVKVGLAGDLERLAGGRVRLAALHFRLLPRPAFVLDDLAVEVREPGVLAGEPAFSCRCPRVVAGLAVTELLRGRFTLAVLRLEAPRFASRWGAAGGWRALGARLAEPAPAAGAEELPGDSLMTAGGSAPPWLRLARGLRLRVADGHWRLTGLPWLAGDLELRCWSGVYRLEPAGGGSLLRGGGELLGGRLEARFFWHRPEPAAALQLDGRLRLTGAVLRGLRLAAADSGPERLAVVQGTGDLLLELNGRLGEGFSLHWRAGVENLGAADHQGNPWLTGFTAASAATGYLAFREGYLNLKSARLDLPGDATVFSRGLIRYRGRLFTDLLNQVRVERLEALLAAVPVLGRRFGVLDGACAGEVNLVGNLEVNPVVRVRLTADRLAYRRPLAAAGGPPCSPRQTLGGLFAAATGGNFLGEVNLEIGRLDLCTASLRQLTLKARKRLNQLLVERLAAAVDGGKLRVSLAVDDLLAQPHWNGSLVLEKMDPLWLLPAWPFAGPLSGSLVLEGDLPAAGGRDAWLRTLQGSGSLTVDRGRVRPGKMSRFLFSFAPRLGLRAGDFTGPFTRLQLPVRLGGGRCYLRGFSLRGPWYRLRGDGTWNLAGRQLQLRGTIDYGRPGTAGRPAGGRLPHRGQFVVRGSLPALP